MRRARRHRLENRRFVFNGAAVSASMFESLYTGFATLIEMAAPALAPHADGSMAFHFSTRGVTVDVMYIPGKSEEHVFVFFAMGPVAEGGPDELRIMRALLEANFLALRPDPLIFSRHPRTGDAVLQRTFRMDACGPGMLLGHTDEAAGMALVWRENFFIDRSNA
jgi:hypothetical protein